MPVDELDTPRRRDAVATRNALLAAARTLLAERGATQTTTRDIAAVVGVNQALINRYFGSKENLFIEAARGGSSGVAEIVASAALEDVPDRVLHEVLEASASGRGTSALLAGVVNDDGVIAVIKEQVQSTFTETLGDRLDEPDGGLRAELLNALIVGITVMRQKIGSPALADADIDHIATYVRLMAEPLLARAPQAPPSTGNVTGLV